MTDEQRCIELLFHADASKHPALPQMLARQNLAYLKFSQSLLRQRAVLIVAHDLANADNRGRLEGALEKEDIVADSIWANCLADLQEMIQGHV